ncbi:hypothetical protein IZY60_09605 [Lutibacter sp. B2]|nr:hypothetical protein [Lutibacter sp. B2]
MKIAFGTVIYDEAFSYFEEFAKSLNNQVYNNFDILLLNDNLMNQKVELIKNELKFKPMVWKGKDGSKPYELRIELIKKAKFEGYDLLILGDFDDTFSETRISSIVEEYDEKYGFFYNELYLLDQSMIFFRNLPEQTLKIDHILESNYLGLSNSALNLNLINKELICDLYKCNNVVFDWFMYSVFLNSGLKGKKIKNGKTFYRIHGFNIAGKSENSFKDVAKEIDIKIKHFLSLKDKNKKFEEKLNFYIDLKKKIQGSEIDILRYLDQENDNWWGKINSKKIEME